MARIVPGPQLSGQVVSTQTGAAMAGVTVTVSAQVYTDQELSTGATTTLTTDGQGIFRAYAKPGVYTFTAAAPAAPIESVEVLSPDQGTTTGSAAPPSLPHLSLFNVETYGAVPYATQAAAAAGTDSTSAIQAAINAAVAAGGGVVSFPSVAFYKVAGALQTPADGQYAQITLPHVAASADKVVLVFQGPGPAVVGEITTGAAPTNATAVLYSTLTGGAYNGTSGWPSVIGAPDAVKSSHMSDPNYFSNCFVQWDGVVVRCPSNPSLAALNLQTIDACDIRDYRADTADAPFPTSAPTHPTGVALLWPHNNNNAVLRGGKLWATGYYGGIGPMEHVVADLVVAAFCVVAHPVLEGYYHAALFKQTVSEDNVHCFAGLDPSTGVTDIPGSSGKRPIVNVQSFDIEDNPSGAFVPVTHIKDASNNLRGRIRFTRIVGGTGQTTGLTVTGATGITLDDALGGSWVAPTLTSSWVNFGGAYATAGYRKYADGTVELKGMVKSGTAPGNGTTGIFTLPAGYRPAEQRIFAQINSGTTAAGVEITPSGVIFPDSTTNGSISLDGIRFLAEA